MVVKTQAGQPTNDEFVRLDPIVFERFFTSLKQVELRLKSEILDERTLSTAIEKLRQVNKQILASISESTQLKFS